ncbi:transglycosylase domain-containing protein [Mucilaginibacter sp. HMF5004]|uniref:transglycosylase domain-containing protein n=1 Tax=Mucilaginibacter rivuli TaxID=2857527 RepID=UPI001C5FCC12|nr:biosynthetic peptidoglycan transglycosylase [Mucilaginibacter rivuli]MBW4890373.1 transglycosylase domain-containing protein [Mucilaginibacter rivuli]
MQRIQNKYIRIAGIVFLVLFVLVLTGGAIAWFKREQLLHNAINKATAKAKRDYNLDVKIGLAHFTGLSTVSFSEITIVPENRDSLLHINNFEVGVKILPLIFGDIKLSSVKLENGLLNLTNTHGVKNFDFLFKKKKDTTQNVQTDLSVVANSLIKQVLYKIPDDLDIKGFNVRYRDDSTSVNMLTKYALIKNSDLSSAIIINNGESTLHFTGKMRPSDKYIDVLLYADNKKVELPFIQKKFGLKLSFDTLRTALNKVDRSDGETRIYSSLSVNNLLINHPKLASNDIIVPSGSMDANLFIGPQYVSVDSSSVIHIKNITANPYIKYTLKPAKIYEMKVAMPFTDAQQLFNSFPQGMFDALEGIQVSGKLAYNLNFHLDSTKPDSLTFISDLQQDNFKVLKYGRTKLTKLNDEFVYTPYEKDKPMPPRTVGPANPYYTPLSDISPYLQHAVMTAEDPSFYVHHGFVIQSIKKSIAINFKEKKFKRGGSTISMQLVKNAFLNRHKTLARKIEETLIVWMIENTHIMAKSRMLEVYFNIIEWGHNVYGIGEASRYYFDKKPSELTLGESIYLASIVPKPKSGLYSFQPDGSLKPYITNYFNLIGGLMAGKGYTERDSSGYGFYSVRLKESLRQKVAQTDSATINQLLKQDEGGDENADALPVTVIVPDKKANFIQRLFGGGKKDTIVTKRPDTIKTPKQLRQERREQKRKEKEAKKALSDKGLF